MGTYSIMYEIGLWLDGAFTVTETQDAEYFDSRDCMNARARAWCMDNGVDFVPAGAGTIVSKHNVGDESMTMHCSISLGGAPGTEFPSYVVACGHCEQVMHVPDSTWAEWNEKARTEGADDGKNAAGWWLQDAPYGGRNTQGAGAAIAARGILKGIEDGDPAVLDELPAASLGGTWADEPTADDVFLRITGWKAEKFDGNFLSTSEVVDSYADAFSQAAQDEIVRVLKMHMEEG